MDLQTGHLEGRHHPRMIFLLLLLLLLLSTMKFFVFFSESVFQKKVFCCILALENQKAFSGTCALIRDVLEGFLKNDSLIVDNSTGRQCIVFLSLLIVLFEGNYFGGNFMVKGQFSRWQLSSGAIVRGAIFLGANYPQGQFSSGAIALEPI